jgi:hypothetical protein
VRRARVVLSGRALRVLRRPRRVLRSGLEYLWRTRKVDRHEGSGSVRADLPPALPSDTQRDELQHVSEGVGPLLHRCYVMQVRDAKLSAAALIAAFGGRPNRASPQPLADFDKVHGEHGTLRVGDEFTIRIPGPWDGPVRVVEVDPNGFGFVTLNGHLEAGRIRFSARDLTPGRIEVRIEAWARGGDHLSNWLFDRIGINKEVQLHMWTSVLERLRELSQGHYDGPIQATTKRVDAADLAMHSEAATPR